MSRPRFTITGVAVLLALALACSRQSAAPTSPTAPGAAGADAAADGSTLKALAPAPISPINDAQVTGVPTLTATTSSLKFGGAATLTYRFQVFNTAGVQIQDSGVVPAPSFTVTAAMAFRVRHTWRVRAEMGSEFSSWSATASFISPEGGYIRGNEVFDPLYNGATVGERIGPTTFVPDKGLRLETNLSYVKYTIPVTITAGEFSMEIEGLRTNAPGDKSKVFGMSTNSDDFITDPYRVDVQYRGTSGFPPNAITFRVLYGSGDDLNLRFEPDTNTRLNSVVTLSPAQTYYWKFTWGTGEVRVTVQEGGAKANGRMLYNQSVRATKGTYNPQPHYAYLGAPTGRSGAESASIPQTIYRNVWIGARARP